MKKDCLYIVMPAYNEEGNIEKVVKEWYPILKFGNEKSRLVIADAGSVDKTHDILLKLKKKYPKLEIISDCLKQHGPKLIYMYKYAIKNGADWIFQTDSDGQTNPKEFEEFWKQRNKYDCLLGNRTKRGDGKARAFVEKVVCLLLRIIFGVKVKDANAPFRLMKSKVVNKYIDNFKEDYNLPNIMLTTYFSYNKEKLVFKEISFKPRQAGVNSINLKKIFKIGWNALFDFYNFRKDMIKNKKHKLLIPIVLFVMSFVFLMNSPLNPFSILESGKDSSVFRTVSMMMHNGYMPYVDTFDHKGPIIYILNYAGDIISKNKGIWIIELISLFVSVVYLYKIARLKLDKKTSLFTVLLSLTCLSYYFEGGNLVEEYALPFIASSLFIFLDYFINNRVNNKRLVLLGFGFGATLLLRPNMAITWPLFCLVILFDLLKNKNYKTLLNYILYFFIGVLIITLPIIVWLFVNHAFDDFVFAYLKFNSSYSSSGKTLNRLAMIWKTIFNYINYPIIIISLLVLLLKKDKINKIYIWYYLLSLILLSMSGRSYLHYMIVIIPTLVYPFALLFDYIKTKDNVTKSVLIIFLIATVVYPVWNPVISELPNNVINRHEVKYDKENIEIRNIIISNTNENNKITVYGNKDIYYLLSNRLPCSKYSYQFPISEIDSNILNLYFNDLEKEQPKVVVVEYNHLDSNIQEYLSRNNYKLEYYNESDNYKSDYIYLKKENKV